ncbi:hypothetical protein K438DRAFT_1130450 [Mycena galopus ATCC 62051]|nr:hypothetical protein K438DRAFT_1130450 [Mycena galopus ATCC 62051]
MSSLGRSMDIDGVFSERNSTLLQILENLEKIGHPAIAGLILPFKFIVIRLELKHRKNDEVVLALLLKVHDAMTVFVQLFTLITCRSHRKYDGRRSRFWQPFSTASS